MSLLCGSNCGVASNPIGQYQDFCGEDVFRKYAYPHYGLIRCDQLIADPTVLASWEALITADLLKISPIGKIDIPLPSFKVSSDVYVCAGDTVLMTTYTVTFSTYQTDDELADIYYFQDFVKNYKNWRLIWFDCDGNVALSQQYIDFIRGTSVVAPTESPGFEYSLSALPHEVEGDGQRTNWQLSVQIELDGSQIIGRAAIPGLLDALKAAEAA